MIQHKAIYPGTFDPITNGHMDIIKRGTLLFPELIIAVAANQAKRPYFSLERRIALIEEALAGMPGVSVIGFDNLLIDFVKEQSGSVILRGLRTGNDFGYEFQLAGMNRKLAPTVETLFLTPAEHLIFISSTFVREIAELHGDISPFVPASVTRALAQKNRKRINNEHNES